MYAQELLQRLCVQIQTEIKTRPIDKGHYLVVLSQEYASLAAHSGPAAGIGTRIPSNPVGYYSRMAILSTDIWYPCLK